MCKLDLKDAYLSVPVHKMHWRFLWLSWEREFYEFTTLPFGLTSAPYVFTKLLRHVASLLRQQEIRFLIYLDDLLLMASDQLFLKDQTAHVITVLHSVRAKQQEVCYRTKPIDRVSGLHSGIEGVTLSLQSTRYGRSAGTLRMLQVAN